MRRRAYDAFCGYTTTNKLPKIDCTLQWESKNSCLPTVKALLTFNHLKITNVFCVLLFDPVILKQSKYAATRTAISLFHLPTLLQNTVSLLNWLASKNISNLKYFYYVITSEEYHGELLLRAMRYFDGVKQSVRDSYRFASVLEKPNTHRLIELCMHTVLIYRHLSNESEKVFESIHRKFKKCLEKNVDHNSHIAVDDMALDRDWETLLFA